MKFKELVSNLLKEGITVESFLSKFYEISKSTKFKCRECKNFIVVENKENIGVCAINNKYMSTKSIRNCKSKEVL